MWIPYRISFDTNMYHGQFISQTMINSLPHQLEVNLEGHLDQHYWKIDRAIGISKSMMEQLLIPERKKKKKSLMDKIVDYKKIILETFHKHFFIIFWITYFNILKEKNLYIW